MSGCLWEINDGGYQLCHGMKVLRYSVWWSDCSVCLEVLYSIGYLCIDKG